MPRNYQGDADVELGVLRLVAPCFHAEPCADAAAEEGEEDEGGFGDAPVGFPGFELVDAVDDEGDEVERYEGIDDDGEHG